jgi:hypothetical protein
MKIELLYIEGCPKDVLQLLWVRADKVKES